MWSGLKVNDLRLDNESPSINVIYDGSISLWRASTNLDVLIVEHVEFSCFELIAFNPFGNRHRFPSIYVDTVLLRSKVNQELIDNAVNEEVKRMNRQNLSGNEEEELKQIIVTFQINILLSRLALTKGDESSTILYLQPQLGDRLVCCEDVDRIVVPGSLPNGAGRLEIIIPMPSSLIPTETIIVPPYRNSIFAKCLSSFNGQTNAVAHQVHVASILLQVSNHFITKMHRSTFFSTLSRPRQRWLKVIDKVLHQNLCIRVRMMLAADLQEQDRLKTKGMKKIMRRPPPLLKWNSANATTIDASHFSDMMSQRRCLSPLSLSQQIFPPKNDTPPAAENRNTVRTKKLLSAFTTSRAASAASNAAMFSRLERQQSHSSETFLLSPRSPTK